MNKNNLPNLLEKLNFSKEGFLYKKSFEDSLIYVDLNRNEIVYPEDKGLIVNEKQICNLIKNENFVVLECVCRLLELGYKPNHIELEPSWKVGRGKSGGRGDILIKNNNSPFLLIECKTYGKEFDSEKKALHNDGGQLFGYAQNEDVDYLCLYASTLKEDIERTYVLISIKDPILKKAKSKNRNHLFQTWTDQFSSYYENFGIFEDNCLPFHLEKRSRKYHDLNKISENDKQNKIQSFAAILRKHNISGRENAFDKLVNLFLAKIIDEEKNKEKLSFYWNKLTFDNYFSLQDRIQKLYSIGMREFLNEEVTYISENDIKDTFHLFKNDPDLTRDKVLEKFRELKFFSNNDFSFIDVHNKKLFLKNSQVLSEIVELFQDIRLKNEDTQESNQILGDLFEVFLDDGIRQNEGQFFTPVPITRFLISSLPLEDFISYKNNNYPVVLDYSCGAGHFLNEYALQAKKILSTQMGKDQKIDNKSLSLIYKKIYGIEKEYRLSKVAKVAAFMYNQNDINIIYKDALLQESFPQDSVDILIANPPYSVSGFLETLSDSEINQYEISDFVKNKLNFNGIEFFFIERAKQVIKNNGIAAIIIKESLLTDTKRYAKKCRELLLRYFDVVAIANFNKNTFSKTGIKTSTLFLKKKDGDFFEHYKNRVNSWFSGNFRFDLLFDDSNLLEEYCEYRGFDYESYKEMLSSILLDKELPQDIISSYENFSDKLISNENILEIEKEKLLNFILIKNNSNDIILVKTPEETDASKRFLGYSWSAREGKKGIQYIKGGNKNKIHTELFENNDQDLEIKINRLIKNKFTNKEINIPESLNDFVSIHSFLDLFDFEQNEFNNVISTKVTENIFIHSSHQIVPIGSIDNLIIETGLRPKGGVSEYISGAYSLGGEHIHKDNGMLEITEKNRKYVPLNFFDNAKKGKVKKGDILLCKDGALTGKLAMVDDSLDNVKTMINEHIFIIRADNQLLQTYLFVFLFSRMGQKLLKNCITGSAVTGINSTKLKQLRIPLPNDIDKIKKVCIDWQITQDKFKSINMSIDNYYNEIDNILLKNNILDSLN